MAGVRRAALLLGCISVFFGSTRSETLLQLNGETSYIQAHGLKSESTTAGTFSWSLWVWPERRSHDLEAIVSLADKNLKGSMTIGWTEGRFYYTDEIKKEPVISNSTYERKVWHSISLTLEPVDKSVVVTDGSPAHRHGVLYVDYQPALEFDTRLPDLSTSQITVGCEYKKEDRRRFFTGVVDELRMYNKALSHSEATSIPFNKPSTASEYSDAFMTLYSSFNDIPESDIRDKVITTHDAVNGLKVKIYYADKVNVAIMPYDAIALSTYTKENIFKNSIDHDGSATTMEGGFSGATITVTGVNFANTFYTKAFVDGDHLTGQEVAVEYIDTSTLILTLPSVPMVGNETATIFGEEYRVRNTEITVSNGGSNSATFMYTFFSVLGEDISRNLTAYYNFKNSLVNVADLDDSSMTASIPSNYGDGGPFFTSNKQGYPHQALKFVRGERVEVPPLFGDKSAWTFCAWLNAESSSRTVYYERDHSRHHVMNLIQLDEEGTIYLDGEAGATLLFSTWQFVCVVKDHAEVHFYVGGEPKATASAMTFSTEMAKGLIGTNFSGVIDDVWAFTRAVDAYTIQSLFANEEYAVEFDGDNTYFTIKNHDEQFLSDKWRGSSVFSVEVYAKVYSITGTVPLWYEPSEFESTLTQAATSEQYDGNYLALVDGKVVFFNLVDSGATSGTASYIKTETSSVVVTADEWFLVSCTFSASEVVIYINGVAQTVSGNKMASTAEKHTLDATYSLESSPQGIIVGCGEQYTVYSGCMSGLIAEVRLWNKALSESEVLTGYTCPLVSGQSGLYAFFKMDEGTGNVISGGSSVKMTFSSDKLAYWVATNYTQMTDATDLPKSPVSGVGSVTGVVDEVNTFALQARDSCDRLRKYETMELQVILAGPLHSHQYTISGTITANGDGTYTGTYSHASCGFWSLRVESTDVPMDSTASDIFSGAYTSSMAKDSPLKVYMEAGRTSAAHSYAFDAPDLLSNNDLKEAFYGAPAAFTVQAADKYGCKKTKGGDTFQVSLAGVYHSEGYSMDNGDGTYTLTYVPMMPGSIQLNVELHGEPVGTEGPEDVKEACGISKDMDYSGSPWTINVGHGLGSLAFDGANYVAVPDDDQLDIPGYEFTLEAWVHPLDPFDGGRIISKESPYVGHGYWLAIKEMQVETGVYVGGNMYRELRSEKKVLANVWTHVAATYDGNTLVLFIDGKKVISETWDTKLDFKENSQKVLIGKGFTGAIDEVRITAEAKSGSEISEKMKCPVPNNTVALYLMMNDGAGEVAYDYSAYGSHGNLKGHPLPEWFSSNAPNVAGLIDFEGSEMSGSGLTEATVGVTASFTMNLVDMCGIPYAVKSSVEHTVQFEKLTLTNEMHDSLSYPLINYEFVGSQKTYFEPDLYGVGEILLTYTPEVCGNAYIGLNVDGSKPEIEYPVKIYSLAETYANTSFMSSMNGAVAGLETSISITAGDMYGCRRTTGGDHFEVLLTRTASYGGGPMSGADTVSQKVVPVDNGDGTYVAYFTAPIAGEYVVDVGFDREDGMGVLPIMHSPHRFTTTPAPWRQYLLKGTSPAPRYEPTTVVYDGEMYVFHGWGSDKMPVADVWKYNLMAHNTWSYRMPVTISNLKGKHEVKLVIDTSGLVAGGKMKADCSDALFVLEGDDTPIGYWLDRTPGCGSAKTGFWIVAPAFPTVRLTLYYGNAHATSTAVSPREIFTSYDDFESGNPFTNGWQMAETCHLPQGDASSFRVKEWSAASQGGSKSLEVDTIDSAGGSIMKPIKPLSMYILKADFYDSDSEESSNWISPNFDDCSDMPNEKMKLPVGLGLGVYTCTTKENYGMLYPWGNTHAPRTAGWHSMEFVSDGASTLLYVDGYEVADNTKMATTIDKIFIRGGGPKNAGEESFATLAAWDNIYVAQYDPEVVVEASREKEEAVIYNGNSWSLVHTRGTSPPARSTDSSVIFEDKLYMLGGYGSAADGLVWYFDFHKLKFDSLKPWGSANLPARQGHSLSLYGDVIYVFGGRHEDGLYNDVWAYSITDNAWSMLVERDSDSGPSPRFGHTAAVYKDTLFVFGGYTAHGASGETWSYDMASGIWTNLMPALSPPSRFSHTVAIQDDSMFIYGGSSGTEVMDDAWRYDFDYNTWLMVEAASDLGNSTKRSDLGAVVSDNTMYVFGGYGETSCYSDFWSMAVY